MKVYILSAYNESKENFAFQNLKKSSLYDPFKKYVLVDNPRIADLVIFVEHHPGNDPYFFEVLKHPTYKLYKNKCYLYHDHDKNLTLIPTISPSVCNSTFNKKLHYPFHYLEQISANPNVKYIPDNDKQKKYLFSFMGASRTYPSARKEIIKCYKGDENINDTGESNSWELNEEDRKKYFEKYADILFQSKFILCPRGIGPSSYRLFESMKIGIAPVIISDDWVETKGVDWKSCSIRIKEKDVSKIEHILKSRENEYIELGVNARKNYEMYMSFENQFHFLSDAAATLHASRNQLSVFDYINEYLRFFEPYHFRNLLRYYKKKYIK
ncbi:exostosin domain-containing protein [Flavobacterium agrisoli]|uniref:Exostosin family protein n=1 Tax=Flavobacterium agrisoli TaxID=2793066 RepID=A0A934PIN8_9FLAO|nr:exostosin family protein [Flavobacterium agrisoli]MBK0368802.1 exostosin family protein [Flavobacterium agrisoli]